MEVLSLDDLLKCIMLKNLQIKFLKFKTEKWPKYLKEYLTLLALTNWPINTNRYSIISH